MRTRLIIAGIVLASVSRAATADIVHLNDGRSLEGTLKRDVSGWIVTDAAGKTTVVADASVKSIQKSSTLPPEVLAEAKVASLRRVVESVSDPKQAVARYEAFIEQNKGTPAAAVATKDLAVWKDRVEKKLSRVGGQWVTTEEHTALMGKTIAAVETARSFIKEGRYREADAALNQILSIDKTNVSAMYLKGLVAAQQEQLGAAKRQFEMVREQINDHAPTLNNLAAVNWRQKQITPALAYFDQALQASPRNRIILDNVAEVLHALTDDQSAQTVAKRIAKRFDEQDAALQKQLETEGLYRWGSTYINKARWDELEQKRQKVKARLDQLARDYQALNNRLQTIDRRIESNDASIWNLQRQRNVADPVTGRAMIRPLPPEYDQLHEENRRLRAERDGLIPQLDDFKANALAAQQELPTPTYTGRQQFFDVEGTPLALSRTDAPKTDK